MDATIGQIGEFGVIERLRLRYARLPRPGAVLLGPGDDAALVAAPDRRVVASTDVLIEGRHFRSDWSSAYDVGRKAAAQNLADIAAMGAVTTGLLVGLVLPPALAVAWVDELADGMADEAAVVGAAVVGGDIVRGDTITIAVTALGDLGGRPPVTRAGARPGDVVAVAGRLGWSAAGLALLSLGRESPHALIDAHRRPQPPYEAGPAAAALGATSLIDVSDGLLSELGHVADASGVRIDVRSAALEVPAQLAAAARAASADPVAWVLTGGEDHALVATFPAGTRLPGCWRDIGAVSAGDGVTVDGEPWKGATGYEHFG